MQRKYAMLIDAGFLKRKLGSFESPMTTEQVIEFTEKVMAKPEFYEMQLHRIYYYDAEPMSGTKPIPLTGAKGEWEQYDFQTTDLYKSNMKVLDELQKKPYTTHFKVPTTGYSCFLYSSLNQAFMQRSQIISLDHRLTH